MEQPLIHGLFSATAAERAGHVAVVCRGREATFEQLDAASGRMAAELAEKGVGAGSIVGVYFEPGLEYVVTILSVLKAGGVYLPLSVDFPGRRLRAILELAEPALVVTDAPNGAGLEAKLKAAPSAGRRFGTHLIAGDILGDGRSEGAERDAIKKRPAGTDACYLLSTSGSTGEPKAILGSHKGLCHFIEWEIREFGLGPGERVSWLSHPTFDVSLRDIFVPLCCGGTLVIPDERVRTSPKELLQWLEESGITLTHIVPTLFRLVMGAIEGRPSGGRALPDLRYAMTAGEALYGYDAIRWRDLVGAHAALVNLYGPSETTLAKLFHRVGVSGLRAQEIVPLGKPIPGARALVLKDGRACGVGEEGEIHIETEFRSLGYFKAPEMTARAFIENPLDPGSKEPLYRTGDLGMLLEDGNIRFTGRADRQVKLRGIRVELGEIEAVLSRDPKVALAAASVDVDGKGDQRLVAYVVPQAGEELFIEPLRAFMAERLPDYMVPNAFVILDSLPLTASGKVDRAKLPAPEKARPRLEQAFVPAAGRAEEELARLWGEALGIPTVGRDDNFFDLGGTSLLAVRLAETVGAAFGIEVPVVKLFEYPKVRLLAEYLAGESPSERPDEDYEERARRKRLRRARISVK